MTGPIYLAHTLGSGGPDLEMSFVAITMLILGIVFFFNKSIKPAASVVLVVAGIGLGAGAFVLGGGPGDAPDVEVVITSPEDGSSVPAGSVVLAVDIQGGSLTTATESDDPAAGHLHIFVDGALESMPSNDAPSVDLEPGNHEITVEFTTADHQSFDPRITDVVSVTAE